MNVFEIEKNKLKECFLQASKILDNKYSALI